MHRRGLQHLESSGSRATSLRRHYAVATNAQTTRPSSANPLQKYRRRPVPPKDGVDDVKKYTEQIVKHAARGPRQGWWVSTAFNGAEDRLRSTVPTKDQPPLPSTEKTKFFSGSDTVEDDEVHIVARRKLAPGTFVELRRNLVTTHGVIVAEIGFSGRGILTTLTSGGELWEHAEADVMFAVQDFVPAEDVARCGLEEVATSESEVLARISILKRTRDLQKRIETEFQKVASALDHALQKPKFSGLRKPDTWLKLTTYQAARMITSKRAIPLVTLFCVHKWLMERPGSFLADNRAYLATQAFSLRPPNEVEDAEMASQMILRQEDSVEEFVKKAQTLIAAFRARPSLEGVPSIAPNESCTFTEEDQTFIRFLLRFLRSSRTIQRDPYTVPVTSLVKRIGMHSDIVIDPGSVHKMLIEMGVLPPWDDPVVRDAQSFKNIQSLEAKSTTNIALPPTQPLGPEDFYPHDIVESIRHDFGDLPVYVIDDAGAQELDDGLSIEPAPGEAGTYWVHVHIADPTALLHPNHKFAQQARRTVQTRYFIQGSDPLLPADLVHNGMSLGSKEGPTKVMTFSFKVDRAGDITDYLVRPALVRNVTVCRYEDVSSALGVEKGGKLYPFGRAAPVPPSPVYSDKRLQDFGALEQVASRLASQRMKRGVMLFSHPAADITMLTSLPSTEFMPTTTSIFTGFPELQYQVQPFDAFEHGARRIVAESMKAASRVASRFFRDRGIPAVRRSASALVTKSEQDMQYLLSLRDENCYVDYGEVIRLEAKVPSAENTLQTKGHWQLGIPDGEGYVRVTSPLRRYSDMVAHWQIKQALLANLTGKNPRMFSDQWLKDMAAESSLKEGADRIVERRNVMYWALKYLENLHDHPERRTEQAAEVLGSLTARPVLHAIHDHFNNTMQSRVIVSSLGLQAVMQSPKDFLPEIGQEYPVTVSGFRLGLSPQLILKMQ